MGEGIMDERPLPTLLRNLRHAFVAFDDLSESMPSVVRRIFCGFDETPGKLANERSRVALRRNPPVPS
jgi:hypothetical protein